MKKMKFTLVELMFTSAISILVTSALLALYFHPYQSWKTGSQRSMLTQQLQFAREKILRSLSNRNGLRNASYHSITKNNDSNTYELIFIVDNNFIPGDETENNFLQCKIYVNDKKKLACETGSAANNTNKELCRFVNIKEFTAVKKSSNIILISITAEVGAGKYKQTLTDQFEVYICND